MGEKLNKNKHTCPKELLQLKNNLQQLVLYLYRYLPVCAYQHCVDTKAGAFSLSLSVSRSLSLTVASHLLSIGYIKTGRQFKTFISCA